MRKVGAKHRLRPVSTTSYFKSLNLRSAHMTVRKDSSRATSHFARRPSPGVTFQMARFRSNNKPARIFGRAKLVLLWLSYHFDMRGIDSAPVFEDGEGNLRATCSAAI